MAPQLFRMKVSLGISWAMIVWTRVIRYFWLWYILLQLFLQNEDWFMIKMMATPTLMMSLFNVLITADVNSKFVKFARMDISDKVEEAALALLRSSDVTGQMFRLSGSSKHWAKLRGAVKMQGMLNSASKKH